MIGNKMKALIEEQGVSQRQLAEGLGEHITQVNKVLNGERLPNWEFIQKFINYFPEVDLNFLFRENITENMVMEGTDDYSNPKTQLDIIESAVQNLRRIIDTD